MKLLSCYISGYGAIKNKNVDFHGNITQIIQSNGIGKTTLASFLKAMLYGLETVRANGSDFKDREHFCPFDGGSFGGTLTLEHQGSTYRIERTFDAKSDKKDTFTVYKDGVETNELSGKPLGVTLLGVDKESFERTLFITADDIDISATDGIKSKLGNAVQGDDAGYKKADNSLDDAVKRYNSTRAASALIPDTRAKINEKNRQISQTEEIQNALEGKYEKEKELRETLNALDTQITAEQSKATRKAERKAYDELKKEIAAAEDSKKALKTSYPNGIPTAEEIKDINELQKKLSTLQTSYAVKLFSDAEQRELDGLRSRFANGIPTAEELGSADEKIRLLNGKKAEKKQLEEYVPTESEIKLRRRFSVTRPSEAELSKAAELQKNYASLKKHYDETPETLSGNTTPTASPLSAAPYIATAIISVLILIVGIALLATNTTVIGAILTALGGLGLLGSAFMFLYKKSSQPHYTVVNAENPEHQRLKTEMQNTEISLKNLLANYGYSSENGTAYALQTLMDDLQKFDSFTADSKNRTDTVTALGNEITSLENSLGSFFNSYGYTEYDITALRIAITGYRSLSDRAAGQKEKEESTKNEILQINRQLDTFKSKYALNNIIAEQLLLDLTEQERLTREIEKKSENAENYRIKHNITEENEEAEDTVSIEQLRSDVSGYRSRLASLEQEIAADESETDKLDSYRSELDELTERLREYEKKHKLLSAAKDLLKEASDAMNRRYVDPVMRELQANSDTLSAAIGRPITVNRDFELLFEDGGSFRKEKHLSSGQRAICSLCFRISLIKNIYRDTVPFVIMDDPFVNLDEANMEQVRSIVEELAEEMQVIYFTCHPSRSITDEAN